MGSLAEIERTIGEVGLSRYYRDKLAALIIKGGYLERLCKVHETCEDLEATEELGTIYRIARDIILLNDSSILEYISRDENIIGMVGMLEYDPHRSVEPGTHRSFLRDSTRFRQVVPIRDADILAKIHQTFRLQYLKDAVLPSIADEGTLPVINTLICFNQVQISNYVHSNRAFADELVGIIRGDSEPEKKRDVVMLLRQLCSMSRGLPPAYRAGLYHALGRPSLIPVLEYALQARESSLQAAGLEILMAILEQDRALVRSHVLEQRREQHSGASLLALVIEGTQRDVGSEAQATCCEALRVLLDTLPPLADPMRVPGAPAGSRAAERETSDFLELFYD
ncbi:Platinum sensitivity protein, partial [Coemansia spiralis]